MLFLVGANDGIIPQAKERNGILTDLERTFLKEQDVELAPTAREDGFMQRFYLYLMMTKPSDRLWISYADMSSAGKGIRPSSLIGRLQRMFPQLAVDAVDGGSLSFSTAKAGKKRLVDVYKRQTPSISPPEPSTSQKTKAPRSAKASGTAENPKSKKKYIKKTSSPRSSRRPRDAARA